MLKVNSKNSRNPFVSISSAACADHPGRMDKSLPASTRAGAGAPGARTGTRAPAAATSTAITTGAGLGRGIGHVRDAAGKVLDVANDFL
jgi:hypothetical protein